MDTTERTEAYNTIHVLDTTQFSLSLADSCTEQRRQGTSERGRPGIDNIGYFINRCDIYPPKGWEADSLNQRLDVHNSENETIGILLRAVMTPREAEYVIHTADPLMSDMSTAFLQKDRKGHRAMIRSPHVAGELYRRIRPHLRWDDVRGVMPLCFGQGGVWYPVCLNECLKISRYGVGGHFKLHRDSPWIPYEGRASIFTVVVYLNDDITGGLTGLSVDNVRCGQREMMFRKRFACVQPISGMALLFRHERYHFGGPVMKGVKYILRTEMIFQRVADLYIDRYSYTTLETYQEMRALYDSAQRCLQEGRLGEFAASFQDVIQIQLHELEARQAERRAQTCVLDRAGHELRALVFEYLSDGDLLRVMLASRGSYYDMMQSPVWARKCYAAYPQSFVYTAARLAGSMWSARDIPVHDWRAHYISRRFLSVERHRSDRSIPAYVLAIHGSGCHVAVPPHCRKHLAEYGSLCRRGSDFTVSRYDAGEEVRLTHQLCWDIAVDDVRAQCARLQPYYGEWYMTFPLHCNQPLDEEYPITYDRRCVTNPKRIVSPSGDVELSILHSALDSHVDPTLYPVVLVGHPAWYTGGGKLDGVLPLCFEVLRCPAICCVHPAACAVEAVLACPSEAIPVNVTVDLIDEHSTYRCMVEVPSLKVVSTKRIGGGSPPEDVPASRYLRVWDDFSPNAPRSLPPHEQYASQEILHAALRLALSPSLRDSCVFRP